MGRRKFVAILAVAAVFVLLGVALGLTFYWYHPFGRTAASEDGSPAIEVAPGVTIPPNITQEQAVEQKDAREKYTADDMVLTVDRMNLVTKVGATTSEEDLKNGPGLYEYAQLPGTGDRNTSIAGHRDLYDCCFYHIDKLQKGDKIYLDYKGYRYTYDYYSTKIVASNDWSVISRQGFSCITLTSCYPLGTSEKRIIVVGILSDIAEHQVS
jgi:sortase A